MNDRASVLLILCLLCARALAAYDLFPLTCSSEDGGYKHCSADTSRGVRLSTTWAGSQPCRSGYSWGFDKDGVWVDKGCRAQFAVGKGRTNYVHPGEIHPGERPRDGASHDDPEGRERSRPKILTCSSEDGWRQYCKAETRSGVTMVRQRSGSPCRESYSWAFDEGGVWVDHGCRADFALGIRVDRPARSRVDGGAEPGSDVESTKSCQVTAGPVRANELVGQCLKVSPATHPPCNGVNSCHLIQDEIRRGCSLLGRDWPDFCRSYR